MTGASKSNMSNSPYVIAILPMKIHSSRVPHKNIRLFKGKPLCYYIIRTLLELKDDEMKFLAVDTDSKTIVETVTKLFPSEVDEGRVRFHMRREELHGDDVSMNKVLDDLSRSPIVTDLKDITGGPDNIVFMQTHSTNPILSVNTIREVLNAYKEKVWNKTAENNSGDNPIDSVFTANKWQTRLYDKNGIPMNHSLSELLPTQSLDPIYEENSCLYVFSCNLIQSTGRRIGKRPHLIPIPADESCDIDTESDWRNALQTMTRVEKQGNIVLITGVCGGIGSATAECFHSEGWLVIGTDTQPIPPWLTPVLFRFEQIDLSDLEKLKGFVKTIDRLDCLVNNAAVQICKNSWEYSEHDFQTMFRVNVQMPFFLCNEVRPLLQQSSDRKGPAAIVNVGSVHAVQTSAQISLYAMTKCSITGMTRSLAIDFAPDGIRVNCVSPGATDTKMLRSGLERGSRKMSELEEKHMHGRIGRPEEIAYAIAYCADNKACFMNGQCLTLDGGASIKLSTE